MKWIKARTSGDIPSPRAFHSGTSVGKNLFIFGGEVWYKSITAGDTFNDLFILNSGNIMRIDKSELFHKVTMRWTKPTFEDLNSIPPARFGHTTTGTL